MNEPREKLLTIENVVKILRVGTRSGESLYRIRPASGVLDRRLAD